MGQSQASDQSTDLFVTTEVEVTVHDSEVLERINDPGWREHMGWSDKADERDLLKHFAANYCRNGIDDVRRLDGWADASEGAVTFIERTTSVEDWHGN